MAFLFISLKTGIIVVRLSLTIIIGSLFRDDVPVQADQIKEEFSAIFPFSVFLFNRAFSMAFLRLAWAESVP